MSEPLCGIYKITNVIDGKSYVGQSIDIERRWEQHKRIGVNKNLVQYTRDKTKILYQAMQKYGIESFSFEIIELCSPQDLYEREQYWITTLETWTHDKKGYNLNDGGVSAVVPKCAVLINMI